MHHRIEPFQIRNSQIANILGQIGNVQDVPAGGKVRLVKEIDIAPSHLDARRGQYRRRDRPHVTEMSR